MEIVLAVFCIIGTIVLAKVLDSESHRQDQRIQQRMREIRNDTYRRVIKQ